jgi:hypothetical protein
MEENNKMKVFRIWGNFTDDGSSIDSLVAEFDSVPNGYSDEDIFFYGLSEENIKEAIRTKEPVCNEFIITSYEEVV